MENISDEDLNEFVTKCRNTCIERYGVNSAFDLVVSGKYHYDNLIFDSKWEIYYYQYLKDNNIPFSYHVDSIKYYHNGMEHKYYPDFKVYDRIVEIKSDYLYKYMRENKNTKEHSKYKCMIDNDVLILQSEDIKLYEDWFYKHYDVNLNDYKIKKLTI